jgi:hypothetical protein
VRRLPLLGLARALFGRDKLLLPLALLLLLLLLGLLGALRLGGALLGLFPQEVLATLDLQVDLALLGRRREWRVRLLGLVRDLERRAPLRQRALLEVGQVPAPVLVRQRRVLGELPLDPATS